MFLTEYSFFGWNGITLIQILEKHYYSASNTVCIVNYIADNKASTSLFSVQE